MINPIRYCLNWVKLKLVEVTINKYRIYGEDKLKLKYKPLLKRPVVIVIRIRVNGKTVGLLVASQQKNQQRVTYVDFIWVNKKKCSGIIPETESGYYQAMYDVFMHWHEDIIVRPICMYKVNNWDTEKNIQREIAISLNISKEQQVEKFRRILTLYGFSINPTLTLKDVEFLTPYRDREKISTVIYSRLI